MKKILLVVAGLSVLAGTQLQARKMCEMVEKSPAYTIEGKVLEGRCSETYEGETLKCKDVTCPACPTLECPPVNVPACMCEAPKKVECNCTPSITVDETCHEVCSSCRQLKADCGCGNKHGHNHKHNKRGRRSEGEYVVE